MKNIEFYTFEDQIWYRTEDGNQHHLTESDRDAIRFIIEKFREFYPEALEAIQTMPSESPSLPISSCVAVMQMQLRCYRY